MQPPDWGCPILARFSQEWELDRREPNDSGTQNFLPPTLRKVREGWGPQFGDIGDIKISPFPSVPLDVPC